MLEVLYTVMFHYIIYNSVAQEEKKLKVGSSPQNFFKFNTHKYLLIFVSLSKGLLEMFSPFKLSLICSIHNINSNL